MRRFDAAPRRATPKGPESFIFCTAARQESRLPKYDSFPRAWRTTALKFPELCVRVSGFPGLVTVWRHVDRGRVTGYGSPSNRTKLLVGTGLSTPFSFTGSFVACPVCHGHRAAVHDARASGRR